MVIRVVIHSEERNAHESKIFKDDEEAIEWLNKAISFYDLDDGCTLASHEDIPAANAFIAEICDDPMNVENYVSFDDIEDALLRDIYERFNEHHWSYDTLMAMADDLCIDFDEF